MRRLFSALILFTGMTLFAVPVKLVSARQAAADVSGKNGGYSVTVKFISVKILDDIGNDRMNNLIARFYTDSALSKFLKADKAVDFSRLEPQIAADGEFISYVWQIPASAVIEAERVPDKSRKNVERNLFSSQDADLYTAEEVFFHDLKLTEALYLSEIAKTDSSKDELITEINRAFDRMNDRINAQDDLLSSEKEEFTKRADKVRKFLLKKLNARSSDVSNAKKDDSWKSLISNSTFVEEYLPFLTGDKALLKMGGCRAFRSDKGDVVLLTVGKILCQGKSHSQMLDFARNDAFVALAEHNQLQVSTSWKMSEKIRQDIKNGKESAGASRRIERQTVIQAAAYVSGLKQVGQWYSPDGRFFFCAYGRIIDQADIGSGR